MSDEPSTVPSTDFNKFSGHYIRSIPQIVAVRQRSPLYIVLPHWYIILHAYSWLLELCTLYMLGNSRELTVINLNYLTWQGFELEPHIQKQLWLHFALIIRLPGFKFMQFSVICSTVCCGLQLVDIIFHWK